MTERLLHAVAKTAAMIKGISDNATYREISPNWRDVARRNQLPPEGNWQTWLLLGGRGSGKTRALVEYARERAAHIPNSRGAMIGRTAAEVRDILVKGNSGILAVSNLKDRPRYIMNEAMLIFPNGSTCKLFSAEVPDSSRGYQYHWVIADEYASWRYPDIWDNVMLGLRLGSDPRAAVATTGRNVAHLKRLMQDPNTVTVRMSTYENRDNLSPQFFERIVARYEGTAIGRQELYGDILEDIEGALWRRHVIETHRVVKSPELRRVVVAIDPAVTAHSDSNETGIVVAGLGQDGHGYVLDDLSLRGGPLDWARQAVKAFHIYKADRIVYESNQGGDMVAHTLRTVEATLPLKAVTASRGKQTRAEPVAALYEQGKVHHVGVLAELEDQLCSWEPSAVSPDRLDALVWALTELMIGGRRVWVS